MLNTRDDYWNFNTGNLNGVAALPVLIGRNGLCNVQPLRDNGTQGGWEVRCAEDYAYLWEALYERMVHQIFVQFPNAALQHIDNYFTLQLPKYSVEGPHQAAQPPPAQPAIRYLYNAYLNYLFNVAAMPISQLEQYVIKKDFMFPGTELLNGVIINSKDVPLANRVIFDTAYDVVNTNPQPKYHIDYIESHWVNSIYQNRIDVTKLLYPYKADNIRQLYWELHNSTRFLLSPYTNCYNSCTLEPLIDSVVPDQADAQSYIYFVRDETSTADLKPIITKTWKLSTTGQLQLGPMLPSERTRVPYDPIRAGRQNQCLMIRNELMGTDTDYKLCYKEVVDWCECRCEVPIRLKYNSITVQEGAFDFDYDSVYPLWHFRATHRINGNSYERYFTVIGGGTPIHTKPSSIFEDNTKYKNYIDVVPITTNDSKNEVEVLNSRQMLTILTYCGFTFGGEPVDSVITPGVPQWDPNIPDWNTTDTPNRDVNETVCLHCIWLDLIVSTGNHNANDSHLRTDDVMDDWKWTPNGWPN